MSDPDNAQQEFIALRDQVNGAQLATLAAGGIPEASYAPLVWLDGSCFLFLSELASHTRNLQHCPAISLMLIEPQSGANAFARRRITLQGEAHVIARDETLFARVMVEFHRRFGKVMEIIEPLPDFHLFRLSLRQGRFVRGFGQAYELCGEKLDELRHIDPSRS